VNSYPEDRRARLAVFREWLKGHLILKKGANDRNDVVAWGAAMCDLSVPSARNYLDIVIRANPELFKLVKRPKRPAMVVYLAYAPVSISAQIHDAAKQSLDDLR